ncbi:high-affinity iron transporter [Mesorhizobium albiziae]|uniref:High-affinity iron transporter n=1 Tax=Neomesorhizobium albiziae TaxID=335020 RepID=A0A1I3YXV2_9HYPH|nr:FTR1 family protein [Mesorhizobium albiziae]GLS33208.1 transport-related membrane protein [Mesorhizobium albiziae]SFK36655.1 high-affinity iron transporter [Mesorhizobium albiziae]
MLSTFIIVFRETLEAALIVAIVLAASKGISGRAGWVAGGVAAGLCGAAIVAFFASGLSDLFDGNGAEVFNAVVLLIAVVMLAWHQIWMSAHAAELVGESRAVGKAVKEGAKPLSALAIICAVAVLREGSETVLFLYGIAIDGQYGFATMLQAGLLGVIAASLVGWLFYAGLLRVPLKQIFRVTGVIIILLAAGLAAQAAAFLVQAGYLPPLGYDIWNTSDILPQTTALGFLLHILVGYVARPEGIQIAAYVATIVIILAASAMVRRSQLPPAAKPG